MGESRAQMTVKPSEKLQTQLNLTRYNEAECGIQGMVHDKVVLAETIVGVWYKDPWNRE